MFANFKIINQLIFCVIISVSCVTSQNATHNKESKIVGGSSISINEAKYQISLRAKSTEKSHGFGYGHICGGSVITQRLVLTAAHCVQKYVAKDLTVVMGNAHRLIRDSQQLQYNVQEIIRHPGFNYSTLINDIALLFINGYVPWNWPTVQAIKMKTHSTAFNSLCHISGWGKMANGKLSKNLLIADVPIISYQLCEYSYGFIPVTMICAGYYLFGGTDTCQGDSGGPFVCNGLLTGVVSWGDGCGLSERPGVYTNVSAYYDWVVKTNHSLNYTLYNSATSLSLSMHLCFLLLLMLLYVCTIIK